MSHLLVTAVSPMEVFPTEVDPKDKPTPCHIITITTWRWIPRRGEGTTATIATTPTSLPGQRGPHCLPLHSPIGVLASKSQIWSDSLPYKAPRQTG